MMKKQRGIALIVVGVLLLSAGVWWFSARESTYLRSAQLGGDYLVRHTNTDGSFVYQYNPVTGKTSSSYNILRHAGTTYALLELYEATGKQKYLRAAERALVFLTDHVVECPGMSDALCVEEDNEIKLGGNALAVLALSKYAALMRALGAPDAASEYVSLAQKLATFLTNVQTHNGEFSVHKITADTGARTDFESEYYPGEALFALARLYAVDGDEQWIDAAHLGAHWLIEVRDKDVPTKDLIHDHWLLYALNELYAHQPEDLYFTHAKRTAESILSTQHSGKTGDQRDWNGGFYNPPRSTPTATRAEGLGAAYYIFKRNGDDLYAAAARFAMESAAVFQIKTQFTGQKLRELNAARAGFGGFHESLDEYDIRIDYVQHNISALVALDRIIQAEAH